MVPTTSPLPGSLSGEKLAFLAALIAAARRSESPGEVRHEITLPDRLTRIDTVIAPSIPARLALEGYSAPGTFTTAPASESLTTGAFGSPVGVVVALSMVGLGAGAVAVSDCGGTNS